MDPTSRYAARDLILRSGRVPIGITVGNPRWPLGYVLACNLRALAPTRSMLGLPTDVFEQIYRARLDDLGVEAIRALLQRCCDDAGNDRLVLLCFEDVDQPGKSCHRRMLATRSTPATSFRSWSLPAPCPRAQLGRKMCGSGLARTQNVGPKVAPKPEKRTRFRCTSLPSSRPMRVPRPFEKQPLAGIGISI